MTTARALAEDLGISERTVYRDVRDLVLSGVPVLGEAGVGYALPRGYDLPPLMFNEEEIAAELGRLRTALRERRKIRFRYVDKGGAGSSRTIWPLGLFFWGKSWSVGGYCELRKDFRNFSAERVSALEVLEEKFEHVPGRTLRDMVAHYENEDRVR